MTTTLTDDELARIKAEVMDTVLDFTAAPYFDIRAIYVVMQANVISSTIAPTTSSTAVTSTGPTVLTLASVAGLASGSRVVLDVDGAREVVTVRAVSGSTISVLCERLHSGTYPVEVESGLTIVRGLLADLTRNDVREDTAADTAGLKRVDEVEWDTTSGATISDRLIARRDVLRDRLARACGISHILAAGRALARGTTSFEMY